MKDAVALLTDRIARAIVARESIALFETEPLLCLLVDHSSDVGQQEETSRTKHSIDIGSNGLSNTIDLLRRRQKIRVPGDVRTRMSTDIVLIQFIVDL